MNIGYRYTYIRNVQGVRHKEKKLTNIPVQDLFKPKESMLKGGDIRCRDGERRIKNIHSPC